MHELRDGSLWFRAIVPADYGRLIEVTVYDGVFAQNGDDVKAIVERIEDDIRRGDSLHWVIEDTAIGELVGLIGFYRGFSDRTGEIGYVMKEAFRGRGYGTRAIRCVCEYGFTQRGFQRIAAYTGADNVGSRKALERNGFELVAESGNDTKYLLARPPTPTPAGAGSPSIQ